MDGQNIGMSFVEEFAPYQDILLFVVPMEEILKSQLPNQRQ